MFVPVVAFLETFQYDTETGQRIGRKVGEQVVCKGAFFCKNAVLRCLLEWLPVFYRCGRGWCFLHIVRWGRRLWYKIPDLHPAVFKGSVNKGAFSAFLSCGAYARRWAPTLVINGVISPLNMAENKWVSLGNFIQLSGVLPTLLITPYL